MQVTNHSQAVSVEHKEQIKRLEQAYEQLLADQRHLAEKIKHNEQARVEYARRMGLSTGSNIDRMA
jgi:DNA-directed RNA polymerase specialized sigma24 family protein